MDDGGEFLEVRKHLFRRFARREVVAAGAKDIIIRGA